MTSPGYPGLGPETDLPEARAQRLPPRAGEALVTGLVAVRPCLGTAAEWARTTKK